MPQWRAERDPVPDLAFGARGEITTTFPQTTFGRQSDDGAGGAAGNVLVDGASSAAPQVTRRT